MQPSNVLVVSYSTEGNAAAPVSASAGPPAVAPEIATLEHVCALAATVDARDPSTYGHSQRVAAIAETMGQATGLPHDELAHLRAAALLHDTGKVGVPDAILTKPDALADEEWEIMKGHSAVGARIVGHVSELAALVPMIRHHHERYDGSGYPDRLKGEDIPIGARIIAIADAYDTMTTQRPYRELVSHEEACEELRRCSGTQFDPELVEMFVWLQVRPPAGPRPPRPEPCSSEVEVQQAQAALSL